MKTLIVKSNKDEFVGLYEGCPYHIYKDGGDYYISVHGLDGWKIEKFEIVDDIIKVIIETDD